MVVLLEIKRTSVGKFLGQYAKFSAPELCGTLIKHLVKIDVDEVILGNVLQAGVGQNPARQAALLGGLPVTVGGVTVNKVCGSGLKSIMMGCQAIKAMDATVIVAGGMESMSNAPHLLHARTIKKYGNVTKEEVCELDNFQLLDSMINDGLWSAQNNMHVGKLAERLAKKYNISRREQDEFALNSHEKAVKAINKDKFKDEIVRVGRKGVDEGPRKDTSLTKLSKLSPVFQNNGSITAGNASSLNDAAAVSVICSKDKANDLGVKPMAEILGYVNNGVKPASYGMAPVSGVKNLLASTDFELDDIDLIELNEAYAAQSIAVVRELEINEKKLNINGGAIALGHPLGASGARILCTLVHALHDRGKKFGLATMCIGGGESVSMVVRRV